MLVNDPKKNRVCRLARGAFWKAKIFGSLPRNLQLSVKLSKLFARAVSRTIDLGGAWLSSGMETSHANVARSYRAKHKDNHKLFHMLYYPWLNNYPHNLWSCSFLEDAWDEFVVLAINWATNVA